MSRSLRCALLLLLALPGRAVPAAPLVISCTDANPSSLVSSRVLEEAYRDIGEAVEFHFYPPAQALSRANDGDVDGTLHRIEGIDQLYPNLVRVPVAIMHTDPVAVVGRRELPVTDWRSLTSYHVGIVRGFIYYERHTAGMDVTRLDRLAQLFAMLDRGRLDVVVADALDVQAALRDPAFRDLHVKTMTVEQNVLLYHYLHKRHEELLPRLRAALEKMQHSGRIEAIREDVVAQVQRGLPLPSTAATCQAARR